MRVQRPRRRAAAKTNALIATIALAVNASACAAASGSAPSFPTQRSQSEELLVQGYNYTDHYIDSFSVDGQGGGNLFVSGPNSGGGKSVCCVYWHSGSQLPVKIKVRWSSAYCVYREKNPYSFGEPYHEKRRSLWKEQDVFITEAVKDKPKALEIHFYSDGHLEAAVTGGDSPPRLKLLRDGEYNRPGASNEIPRCADDAR